jgi:hypothetical protein
MFAFGKSVVRYFLFNITVNDLRLYLLFAFGKDFARFGVH